jgi:hypothetical protein
MAQSGVSLRRINSVGIGGIADIPQASRAHRCDALDPQRSWGGSKSRSAALSCLTVMCPRHCRRCGVLGDGRMRGVALGTARATISRTPSGLIAKHDFGNSEARLMSCQQFAAHLLPVHSSPLLVAMGECANSQITKEPCYLRDRKVGVTQVMPGPAVPRCAET